MISLTRTSVVLAALGALLGTPALQSPAAQSPAAQSSATLQGSTAAPVAALPAPAPAPPPPVAAEVMDLRTDLASLLPGADDARYGVLVVSLDRGDTLFAANADLPLAPASNLKLFSTAAALYYLGPEYRFATYLLADGPVRDGVVEGDLVLYGSGDPALSRRMLESTNVVYRAFADSLRAIGVREVRGAVVGDGSYYDADWIGEGWKENDRMAWYAAPVGALSYAENMVSVRVLPGSVGGPAQLRTTPATNGLAIENRVRTVSSGATRVRFEHGVEGLVIEGQIRRGHPGLARSVPVVDPGNFAAAALHRVLEDEGIEVTGGVRAVRSPEQSAVSMAGGAGRPGAPAPQVLAVHLSPTLQEIVTVTNHISHNLFAEALLKAVGRVALGDGSFAGGARAVEYFLECEMGVDSATIHLVDGSGLSRFSHVTARATVELLDYMADSGLAEAFHASLPEAAARNDLDHSLRNRMGGTAAASNLRAKTGTIKNVSTLSGYVRAANGERLAFSILGNGLGSTWRAKRTEDAIGARLARFQRPEPPAGTPVSELVGEPAGEAADPVAAAPPAADDLPRQEDGPVAVEEPRTHRVRAGDTLDGIARRYGTTVAALREANPGIRPQRIQIGQTIRLPQD